MDGNSKSDCAVKREPVAHDVMELVSRLAATADKISDRTAGKLAPICRQPCPAPDSPNACGLEREYPPYFNELRDKLSIIDRSFNLINDVLDRAEV